MDKTLDDLASQLPNGLHDALLHKCSVDFVARTAAFEVDVWLGDVEASTRQERERRRRGSLLLKGLAFCEFERPDPTYPYSDAKPLMIDLCEPDSQRMAFLRETSPLFLARIFVSNWNSFIHLAAQEATLVWSEP